MVYRTIPIRKSQNDGGGGTYLARLAPAGLVAIVNASARWTLGSVGWLQTDITDGGSLQVPIPSLPTLGHLLEARFKLSGGAGRAALPASMPSVLVVQRLNTGATQLGVTVIDTSATPAAYMAPHELVVEFNLDLAATDFDWINLVVIGESGANSVASQLRLSRVDLLFG